MNANTEINRTAMDTLNDLKTLVRACESIDEEHKKLLGLIYSIQRKFYKATPKYDDNSKKKKIVAYVVEVDEKEYNWIMEQGRGLGLEFSDFNND